MGLRLSGGSGGAQALTATAVKTSAYSAAAGDLIPVDATSGAVTVTLPTAPADRTRVAVKKIDASTNIVTVSRGGSSDVFNKAGGSTSLTLVLANQALSLQYSAGIWYVVGDDLPLSGLDSRFSGAAGMPAAASTPGDGQALLWDASSSKPKGGTAQALAPFAYAMMHKLETDSDNVVLAVSGDSVSNDTTDWVNLLAASLGAKYPKFTVIIKNKTDAANTYTADITVQTGAGGNGHTFTVYNWSQSGAGTGVGFDSNATQAVFELAYPTDPDLFLIATGHNDDVDTEAKRVSATRRIRDGIRRIAGYYPNTPIAFALMNPKTTANANYLKKFTAEEWKVAMAADMGLGVLNLEQAWLDRIGGYADLMFDDTHPNITTGMQFLAATAYDHLMSVTTRNGPTNPVRRRRQQDELYIPLLGGYAIQGSPAADVQATYSNLVGVAFDSVADETWVLPPILLPEWWQSWSVDLDWCAQGNVSGNAYWEVRYGIMAATGTGTLVIVTTAAAASAASSQSGKVITSSLIGTSPAHTAPTNAHTNAKTVGANYPFQFRLKRLGTNVLDTLEACDALALGIRLTRHGRP